VDRVVFNAIGVEARRRWIVFDIVFAAFCNAKKLRHFKPGHRPAIRLSRHPTMAKYRLCKRANACVNYSAEHCSTSYQSNVALALVEREQLIAIFSSLSRSE